jgi:hypothetical protein
MQLQRQEELAGFGRSRETLPSAITVRGSNKAQNTLYFNEKGESYRSNNNSNPQNKND